MVIQYYNKDYTIIKYKMSTSQGFDTKNPQGYLIFKKRRALAEIVLACVEMYSNRKES